MGQHKSHFMAQLSDLNDPGRTVPGTWIQP